MMPAPYFASDDGRIRLYHGDSLAVLGALEGLGADCVLADPPYSSGGLHRAERAQSSGEKYVLHGTAMVRPDFSGDNRDQRSWTMWCSLWMSLALRTVKPGAILMSFCDWRQYPALSDAIQAGGWVWRGALPWDKTEGARPQRGFFRAQAEYVLTASAGSMGKEQEREVGICKPGVIRCARGADDHLHQTAKPVEVCAWLLDVVPADGLVLDPFAGSCSTGVACIRTGRRCVLVEVNEAQCAIGAERLKAELAQRRLAL